MMGVVYEAEDPLRTNGTWVGERRVKEGELENHGEFRLGRTRFMLIVTDPE